MRYHLKNIAPASGDAWCPGRSI